MQYSTAKIEREISVNGIEFDRGSVYDRLCQLTDLRGVNGRRYRLETVLMIVIIAKLCGEDTPLGIAEWAKHRQEALVKLLHLSRPNLPSHHTYRRILAYKVYAEEVERLVGTYNQQGSHGEVYALDGKAVRGMRKKDEEGHEYLLSVYDVEHAKVMSQVAVGRKENEIAKAPQALKLAEISKKVVTGDALHTQRGFAAQILEAQGDYVLPVKENQPQLYKNIQALFAPEYPKPGFGKIQTDFLTAQKVNKGHGRIEIRTITTSEMLNPYAAWPGLAQVYRLERQFQWRRNGRSYRTSCEVEFGITSLSRKVASPERLLNLRRAHWGIETGLHFRRDVTLKEDATRMTVGNTGKIMASIIFSYWLLFAKLASIILPKPDVTSPLISQGLSPCLPPLFLDFEKAMGYRITSIPCMTILCYIQTSRPCEAFHSSGYIEPHRVLSFHRGFHIDVRQRKRAPW